jgi:hypothetical protein
MPVTNDGQQSTHHHANEQLLIGWMAGAPGSTTTMPNSSTGRARRQHRTPQTMAPPNPHHSCEPASPTTGNDPAPAPSPASHCSRGGSRVLAAYDDIGEHQDTRATQHHTAMMGTTAGATRTMRRMGAMETMGRMRTTMGMRAMGTRHTTATLHLPPLLRASARRVCEQVYFLYII